MRAVSVQFLGILWSIVGLVVCVSGAARGEDAPDAGAPGAAPDSGSPGAAPDSGAPESTETTQTAPENPAVQASTDADDDRILDVVRRWEGQTLSSVDIQCEDPEICGETGLPLLRSLLRLQIGAPVKATEVAQAWSRLARTDAFRSLSMNFAPAASGTGVSLLFEGKTQVVITDVNVRYVGAASRWYPKQFETQIRKRLQLRKGNGYPVDDPAALERQVANVLELYETMGYRGTEVRFEPHFSSTQSASDVEGAPAPPLNRVEVDVIITEGDQDPIAGVLIQGIVSKSYTEALAPIETGERVDFWRDLFRFVGVGTYERRRFREQLKVLEQQYRDEGFFAARVRLEDVLRVDGEVYPLVRVQEGPRVEVAFEGHRSLSLDVLRGALTFVKSGAVDDTEIEASRVAIIQAYQATGRYYAQVAARREKLDPKGARQLIVFHIDEGTQVYVRTVRFKGNHELSNDQLGLAMTTRGVGKDRVIGALNASDAVLQDARVANDLNAIRDLYRERGYSGIRFRCMPPEQDPAVWEALRRLPPDEDRHERLRGRFDVWNEDPALSRCFRVERDRDSRLVDVVVELDEGPRTTVNRVDMKAILKKMPPEMQDDAYELLETLGFTDPQRKWQRNIGLNRQQIVSLEGFILRFYRGLGYTHALVEAHCADSPKAPDPGPPVRAECTPAPSSTSGPDQTCSEGALYGRKVDHISFRVQTGPRTIVQGILIRGNLQTKESTIRKELLFTEGEPLSTDDLFASQSNLRSLGIFETVKVETIGAPDVCGTSEDDSPVVVKVDVEETNRFQLQANFGLSIESSPLTTDELPLLFIIGTALRDRNFLQRGLEGTVTIKHANRLTAPTDVYGDDSRWEFGPGLTDRRFFATRVVGTIEGSLQGGLTPQRDLYERRGDLIGTLSYDFSNLSYPSDWGRGLLGSFKTTYGRKQQRDLTRRNQIPEFGDPVNELKFEPQVTLDKRDNPLHPSRGFLASLNSEARFLSNALVPSLLEPALKETLTGQFVQSFFERRLILVPTLRLGAVQTRDVADERLRDYLFKAGGDAVTHPVRGYADASIDACNGKFKRRGCASAVDSADDRVLRTVGGRAFVGGSFEARFPTFIFDDFWFAAFGDFGAVAPSFVEMRRDGRDRFYPSVGGGLRWLVTGQIPLRLDVGMPLRETVFSKAEPRLHLNIFYQL